MTSLIKGKKNLLLSLWVFVGKLVLLSCSSKCLLPNVSLLDTSAWWVARRGRWFADDGGWVCT